MTHFPRHRAKGGQGGMNRTTLARRYAPLAIALAVQLLIIVDYVSNYGAEVNAILLAEGQLVTYADSKPFDAAMEKFINDHYMLYGRKVKIITYSGQCTSVPPDYNCLLPEMDRIVDQYKPYMVFWNTTLCSQCYAELARKKVIGCGSQ